MLVRTALLAAVVALVMFPVSAAGELQPNDLSKGGASGSSPQISVDGEGDVWSAAAPSTRETKTFIYVGARRVGYVHGSSTSWEASWGAFIFATVEYVDSRTFVSWCETHRYRYGYAKRRIRTQWTIWRIRRDASAQVGYMRFVSPGRWNVYNRNNKLAGRTVGPHGVAAGLAWLTLRICHD